MDGKTYDRAAVNLRDAKNLATAFFPLASLDEASIQEMSGYDDRNFYLETVLETDSPKTKRPFTLKVTNRKESKDVALLDAQNDLMLYLRSGGFPAPQPIQTRDGSLKVLHPIAHPDCSEGDPKYAIRLLTFLAGELLAKVERTDSMLRHVGEFIGKMSIHLKDFPPHEAIDKRDFIWNLGTHLLSAKQYISFIETDSKRQLATEVMDAFESLVLPVLQTLPMDYIHGDLNDYNILMGDPDVSGERQVSGIIDYGDIMLSYRVVDIATLMAYMSIGKKDGLRVASQILAGYQSVHPLSDKELDLLYYLIAGRLCQSCVLCSYYYSLHPTNDYLLVHARPGWITLQEIWSQSKEGVDKILQLDKWQF